MTVTLAWIDELVSDFGTDREPGDDIYKPTEDDVRRIERRLGGVLPTAYRYFVERFGGLMLGTDDFFPVAGFDEPCPWGSSTRPETFYGLDDDSRYSLGRALSTFEDRLPKGVLPIAHDAGGNQICLDVGGAFPGAVFFWDHEQRWFRGSWESAARELEAAGVNTRQMSVHDVICEWNRRNPKVLDRPPDYMGMYRMARSFEAFLRALRKERY